MEAHQGFLRKRSIASCILPKKIEKLPQLGARGSFSRNPIAQNRRELIVDMHSIPS